VQREYFSPANLYKQNSETNNINNNHRANFSADYQIDSFHSLKISPAFSYQKTKNHSASDYSTASSTGSKINEGSSDNVSNNEGTTFSMNVLFRKKFHKKGRSFSLNLLSNLNNSDGDGRLQSLTNFYNPAGIITRRDSINQQSASNANLRGYNVRAVYTEPVFKRALLEFSLSKSYSSNESSKSTFDFNRSNGKFDLMNNLLSNDFLNTYSYMNAGLRFRKQTKKYNYFVRSYCSTG